MEIGQLFVMTWDELGERVAQANDQSLSATQREYQCLMMAPLLRKLLLDGTPLVTAANRGPRLTIRYPLQAWPVLEGSGGIPIQPGLPEAKPPWFYVLDEVNLTKDDMLARPVAIWNRQVVTARDVINHQSNVAGGVHIGRPRTAKQELLLGLEGTVRVLGLSIAGLCVAAVGRATHMALGPLYEAIASASDR